MLSAPVRREFNNDTEQLQQRNLQTYATHTLYGDASTVQDTLYGRQNSVAVSPRETLYGHEYNNTAPARDKDTLAMKLYGETYDPHREAEVSRYPSKTQDYENENLMPSRATMAYPNLRAHYSDEQVTKQVAQKARPKTSTHTKVLIASYVAVVLALVLIITLASVSIASLFSQVSALQAEFDTQAAAVAELNADIAVAESDEFIMTLAPDHNMYLPEGAQIQTYAQPEVAAASAITASGNWFNNFTKWLSGLFK